MILRYVLEGLVGLISLPFILYFGQDGQKALASMAIVPVILLINKYRVKPDEREIQLFYKTSNYTLVGIILSMVAVNHFSQVTINGHLLAPLWMPLCISLMFVVRGIIGLIVFKTQ